MRRRWPLLGALAIYWAAVAYLVAASTRMTGGRFVYPLDDAYIHMAMAKNAVLHGVWGVTRHGFTSSTSSPLWTAMLAAADAAFGVRDLMPLALNVAAGTAIVATIHAALARRDAPPLFAFAALAAVIGAGPLPTLTVAGMEHTAHALATLWLVFASASALSPSPAPAAPEAARLALLAAMTAGLRYEGAIAAAVVASLFLISRRWRAAVAVVAGAGVPITAYGLWSMWHGWLFLPNSVLLKGTAPAATAKGLALFAVGSPALHALVGHVHMFVLLAAALLALLWLAATRRRWDESTFLLAIVAALILGHAQVARFGWFYRYEAYLVIAALAALAVVAAPNARLALPAGVDPRPLGIAALALVAVVGFPLASRGLNAFRNTPRASANVFQQQYQMGLFLETFYRGRGVAANDVGAIGYLADVRLLDVYGLATRETARMRWSGAYAPSRVGALAREQGTAVAVVYESWFGDYGGVPDGWTRAGSWQVPENVVLGESTVSFYAVDPAERAPLLAHLRAFAPRVPGDVIQSGEYRLAAVQP